MDEIGQKLRDARADKGYTLDDLQQITKIQKRYLIAIEEGNFDALPGDFYVRAFIKQYADTVGVDSDALLTQYQQDIPTAQPQEYVSQSVENKSRAQRIEAKRPAKRMRRLLPQLGIGLLGLLLIVGVYWITVQHAKTNRQPIPEDQPVAVTSSKESVDADKESAKKAAEASSKAAAESKAKAASIKAEEAKKKLTITATPATGSTQAVTVANWPAKGNALTLGASNAQAWVSVNAGGRVVWQGALQPGKTQTVPLADGVTAFSIHSGNAPATTVSLNQQKVDISQGTSIVRTINFTTKPAATTEAN